MVLTGIEGGWNTERFVGCLLQAISVEDEKWLERMMSTEPTIAIEVFTEVVHELRDAYERNQQ